MENYERVIFAPDIHAPYQDEKWLASFLKFIKYFKPDTIFIMGDLIDFYAISRFLKDPDRALRLQEEIDCAVNILKQIRYAYLKANIYYIRGNHEYRLQKYLWSNAKELAGLRCIKIETLLELERFRIKYIEQGRLDYHGLVVKHGSLVRKYAAYTAKGEFEKTGKSGVSAHTHRGAIYYQSNAGGNYAWMECGCGCQLDAEYLEGETPNWLQGWGVGHLKKTSNRFNLESVPFVDGKAMYQGKEF